MATTTKMPKRLRRVIESERAIPSPAEASARAEPCEKTPDQQVYWGDWFAFKLWIICFLIMAAMNLYDAMTALFRR